jgi:hypothetical protein
MWLEAEMTVEMPIRAHLLPGQRAKGVRGLMSVEALGDYQQEHNENRCRAGHTQHLQNASLGRSSLGYSFSKTMDAVLCRTYRNGNEHPIPVSHSQLHSPELGAPNAAALYAFYGEQKARA